MPNFMGLNMPENVTDLTKLRDAMTFMAGASRNYRKKVKDLKERKEALDNEPQVSISPSTSLKGDTTPSGPTTPL